MIAQERDSVPEISAQQLVINAGWRRWKSDGKRKKLSNVTNVSVLDSEGQLNL